MNRLVWQFIILNKEINMEKVKNGLFVSVDYKWTLQNGEVFVQIDLHPAQCRHSCFCIEIHRTSYNSRSWKSALRFPTRSWCASPFFRCCKGLCWTTRLKRPDRMAVEIGLWAVSPLRFETGQPVPQIFSGKKEKDKNKPCIFKVCVLNCKVWIGIMKNCWRNILPFSLA